MPIGTRIIQLRNQKNVSQRQLSERSGLASSYLSRIENRKLEPRPTTLRKIAEGLGVSMGEIFQEGPAAQIAAGQCVISTSGACIMHMLANRRRRSAVPTSDTYTPRQLQLLRMTDYLIHHGSGRVLDSLEVMLSALMTSARSRREAEGSVSLRGPALG